MDSKCLPRIFINQESKAEEARKSHHGSNLKAADLQWGGFPKPTGWFQRNQTSSLCSGSVLVKLKVKEIHEKGVTGL